MADLGQAIVHVPSIEKQTGQNSNTVVNNSTHVTIRTFMNFGAFRKGTLTMREHGCVAISEGGWCAGNNACKRAMTVD